MNKLTGRIALAATLIVGGVACANAVDTSHFYDAAMHCQMASEQLMDISVRNRNVACVENVSLTATYLEAAAKNAWRNKTDQALMYVGMAANELNDITLDKRCVYLAPKVKPYTVTLKQIKIEMDMLDSYVQRTLKASN